MPVKNLDNLETILNQIWDGTLEHDQTNYFCETSCCVAGWCLVINYSGFDTVPVSQRSDYYYSVGDYCHSGIEVPNVSVFMKEFYSLSPSETTLIVDSYSTRALHETTLKALKEGRRIDLKELELSIDCGTSPADYLGIVIITLDNLKNIELMREFLGDYDKEKIIVKQSIFSS